MHSVTSDAEVHICALKMRTQAVARLAARPGVRLKQLDGMGGALDMIGATCQAYLVDLDYTTVAEFALVMAAAHTSGAAVIASATETPWSAERAKFIDRLDGVIELGREQDEDFCSRIIELARAPGTPGQRHAAAVTDVVSWELDPVQRCFSHCEEFSRLFGFGECRGGASVGQLYDIVVDEERAAFKACFETAMAVAGQLSVHFRIERQDGTSATVVLRGCPVHQAQGISRLVGIAFEVEDAGNAELMALRTANRCKDEFIATMAHELRNPLTAILCASELIGQTAPVDGPLAVAAAVVRRQLLHTADLVDEMRDIGFAGVTVPPSTTRLCKFDDVLRNACEQSMPLIAAHAHSFVVESMASGALVMGNFTQLVQIVANLLNNAAKYTPDGGTIRLRTESAGGRLRCEVSDSGIGMPPGFIDRAFDAFVQADGKRHHANTGIGLGLKLVREFATIHGGSIVAHSDGSGHGSTFALELPLAASPLP